MPVLASGGYFLLVCMESSRDFPVGKGNIRDKSRKPIFTSQLPRWREGEVKRQQNKNLATCMTNF